MNIATRTLKFASVAFLLAVQHTISFAQSQGLDVNYQPVTPSSIPTLSEWGMIALSLLLVVVAFYTLRGNKGGKPLAAVFLASSLTLGGLGSKNLISEAHANGSIGITNQSCPTTGILCYASSPSGGTVTILTTNEDVEIRNTSGVAQKITAVLALNPPADNDEPPFNNSLTPRCMTLPVLQPGASCWVNNRPSGNMD